MFSVVPVLVYVFILRCLWSGGGGVRGGGPAGRVRMRLSRRVTRKACTGLTVVSRSSSRFVLSFVHIIPNTPGTRIGDHIVLAPSGTGQLLFTLRSGLTGFRRRTGNGATGFRGFIPPVKNIGKRT